MQRIVNKKEAMLHLGLETYAMFNRLMTKLDVRPVLGGNYYDIKAIDRALDSRGKLATTSEDVDDIIMGRLNGDKGEVSRSQAR